MLMPALFIISAKGIMWIYDKTKRYNKEIAMIIMDFDKVLGVIGSTEKASLSIEAKNLIKKREFARKIKIGMKMIKFEKN